MSKQEIAVVPTREVALPSSIPMPVFDEHVERYLARATNYYCENAEDFERAKLIRGEGTKLRGDITASFAEPKRIIDAIKQPFLDLEAAYLAKLKHTIGYIDAMATAWKAEQDRIAQAEAEVARQEEIARREAARQVEIARLEDERNQKMVQIASARAVADEWDDSNDPGDSTAMFEVPLDLPPVIVPEIVEPRRVTIESEFKSARGVRNKPRLVVRVVDPDLVGRAYCSPDPIRYTASVKANLALIQNPTPEQLKALEDKIGGIKIFFE